MFEDRRQAGERLAPVVAALRPRRPVVLAVPRGGVLVAVAVAEKLAAPVDLIIPRKLRAPQNEELAIGAVIDGGYAYLDERLTTRLAVEKDYIKAETAAALREIDRRRELYLQGRPPVSIEAKTAIIIDDGLATGATMMAAVKAVKARRPRQIIVAVPVASPPAAALIEPEVDALVVLEKPPYFYAVGQFYRRFNQVDDAEVTAALAGLGQDKAEE